MGRPAGNMISTCHNHNSKSPVNKSCGQAMPSEPRFFLALVYRYLNTEITPGISQDGFRNVLLAVRAEACGRFCGSVMLAEAFAEAPGDPT